MGSGVSRRIVDIGLSPGHTWITAPDPEVAWFAREAISAADCTFGHVRQGGRIVAEILDLGASGAARAACEALVQMGVEFRWHQDQDPARGEQWHHDLPGIRQGL